MRKHHLAYGLFGLALTSFSLHASANKIEQCFAKAVSEPCSLISQSEFDKLTPPSIKSLNLKAQHVFEESDLENRTPEGWYCRFEPTFEQAAGLMSMASSTGIEISVEPFDKTQLETLPEKWQQKLAGKSTKEIFTLLMQPETRKNMMMDVVLEEELGTEELEMAKAMFAQMPTPQIESIKNLTQAAYYEVIDFGMGLKFTTISLLEGQHILNIELEHSEAEQHKKWLVDIAKNIVDKCKK